MIPTLEVLEMMTQPLLTSSIVDLGGETDKYDSREDEILDLFEIGDKYEGGF